MINSFELITKYAPQLVDDYFVNGSKTVILENGSKFMDLSFKETGYVKIADLLLDGMSDYYKHNEGLGDANHRAYNGTSVRDGFGLAGTTLRWEIKKLRYLRGTRFEIDAISNEQTANVVLGNIMEHFVRYKLIPEVDATRFSAIAEATAASLGNLVVESAAIAANTIIGKFNAAFQWLSEHEVPTEEQVIFVNPAIMTLIRNSTELTKFLTQGDYRSPEGIDFTVSKYMGRPIIEVPNSRFYTNIYVDPNNGFRPSSSSKLMNFLICSVRAVVPVRKLELTQVYGPEQAGIAGFYGYIIQFLLFHDTIIPDNKVTGVYVDVDNATTVATKAAALSLHLVEGSVTDAWKLKNYFTNPAGMRGTVCYKGTSGFTLGATLSGTEGTDYFVIGKDEEKVDDTATSYYFCIADESKKIIAVSDGAITLPKKA